MVSPSSDQHDQLPAVIQRYGEVADAVNRREMQRFIDEVTLKWHPEPEDEATEPHLDGYTDAGVLNLHIFLLAFDHMDSPQPPATDDRPLCDAERYNQVMFQPPVESLVDLIPKPLADPSPSDQVKVKLEVLEAALRQQVEESGGTQQVYLPQDFATLMALTNGVQGAGVPAETAHLELISPLERQDVEPGVLKHLAFWVRSRGQGTPIAAWKIGACIQHRNIYYVFCQSANAISPSWKIFDHVDVEVDIHENLTRFIRHETERVRKRPGGALIEEILIYDSYPIY